MSCCLRVLIEFRTRVWKHPTKRKTRKELLIYVLVCFNCYHPIGICQYIGMYFKNSFTVFLFGLFQTPCSKLNKRSTFFYQTLVHIGTYIHVLYMYSTKVEFFHWHSIPYKTNIVFHFSDAFLKIEAGTRQNLSPIFFKLSWKNRGYIILIALNFRKKQRGEAQTISPV